jgi:hypothetical protein
MKRKNVRILISFAFPAFWLLYLGIQFFNSKFPGHNIDIVENVLMIIFTILMFGSPVIVVLLSKYDYQYVDYLESDDTAKPTFRVACSSVIDVPEGFDFKWLKIEIANKWWITFSNDMSLLKFRIKWHPFKQKVVAAWLKFDADTGKVQLECFPIQGKQHDYLAVKMQKEIEQCLNSYKSS